MDVKSIDVQVAADLFLLLLIGARGGARHRRPGIPVGEQCHEELGLIRLGGALSSERRSAARW
jgi:hypothetical protein